MQLPGDPTTYIDVLPERGATICDYTVDGKRVLYMDDEMGTDSPIIRGGIPVLFPVCGPVRDGRYSVQGEQWPMPQHGFIRDMAWCVVDLLQSQDESRMTLTVADTDYSRQFYPYAFRLHLTYIVRHRSLHIHMTIRNVCSTAMPVQTGFHPYFLLDDKENFHIWIRDNVFVDGLTGQSYECGLSDVLHEKLHDEVTNLRCHFPDGNAKVRLVTSDWDITIEPEASLNTVVFWSLVGKPFLCVEPWSGCPGAINQGTTRWIEAGHAVNMAFTIRVSSP